MIPTPQCQAHACSLVVISGWLEDKLLEAQLNPRLLSVSARLHLWYIARRNTRNTSPQKSRTVMLLNPFQDAGFKSKVLKDF